ncbi:MAG TPA: hypothetical protein VFU16_04980 [Solirubrobacterales bacterium]|nr:hypothetical protein [Solirubrobacterales bacterium]
MPKGVSLAALALLAAVGWTVKLVLAEPLNRVSRRLADWLFPEARPLTYRLARFVLALTTCLAPHRRTELQLLPLYMQGASTAILNRFHPSLKHCALNWGDLAAAAAELEVDERGDRQAKALRLVSPLLREAISMHLRNAFARLGFAGWYCVVRPVAVMLFVIVVCVAQVINAFFFPFVLLYEYLSRRATAMLMSAVIRRLPPEMPAEERHFWTLAMQRDQHVPRRHVLTRRLAVEVWIRRRLPLPDRELVAERLRLKASPAARRDRK